MRKRIVMAITLTATVLLLLSCQNNNSESSKRPATTALGEMKTEVNHHLEDAKTENKVDESGELKEKIIGSWSVVNTTYTYKSNNEVFYFHQPERKIIITFGSNGQLYNDDNNSVAYEVTEDGYVISYGAPLKNEKGHEVTREEALENAIKRKIHVSISEDEMIITSDLDDEDLYQTIRNDKGEKAEEPLYIKQVCTRTN